MKHEGPALETLLHHLSHCPADLHQHANRAPHWTMALVCDYFRRHEPTSDVAPIRKLFMAVRAEDTKWMPLVVWLIMHPWFLARHDLQPQLLQLFSSERLKALAKMFKLESLVGDPDRREELVRIVLLAVDHRPAGETIEQALDRLNTLDSVERKRILEATSAAEKRAREVREAMARARAQESASRYGE